MLKRFLFIIPIIVIMFSISIYAENADWKDFSNQDNSVVKTTSQTQVEKSNRFKVWLNLYIVEPMKHNLEDYKELIVNQWLPAIILIILGWLIAKIIQILTRGLLRLIHFDDFCDATGITTFLESGGISNLPSTSVANIFYWILLFFIFTLALDMVSKTSAFQQIQILIIFVPMALLAVFMILIGYGVSKIIASFIESFAANSGIRASKFIRYSIITIITGYTIVVVLKNLIGVDGKVITGFVLEITKYTIIAGAIAFGIGARFFAADLMASIKLKKTFKVSDEIKYDNIKGVIKSIGLFNTTIYADEGLQSLPNSILARKIITSGLDE